MQNGECFRRPKSGPRTAGKDSSCWPIGPNYPTPDSGVRTGHNTGGQNPDGTPRPTLAQFAKGWATPTVGDSFGAGSRNANNTKAHKGTSLSDQIITGSSTSGRRDRGSKLTAGQRVSLNPLFVERLMGLPIGWTDFEPLGMEWSHYKLRMRSRLSLIDSCQEEDHE